MATLTCSVWGGANENSYVTLAEANDYIGSNTIVGTKLDPTPWTDLNTIRQASLLLAATRDVDNAENYVGSKVYQDQSLEFPRVPDGQEPWPYNNSATEANTWTQYLLDQRRRVKSSTIEQAFYYARQGTDQDEHRERQTKGIRSFSESIGPISESASYGGSVLPLCPEAMAWLKPFFGGAMELVRG